MRYIIEIFINQRNTTTKLFYTSNDIPTLDNKLFRRDEIYFVRINESNFTDMVSLYDFEKVIRNYQPYWKIYLDGKISFDPHIKHSIIEFFDNDNNKNIKLTKY